MSPENKSNKVTLKDVIGKDDIWIPDDNELDPRLIGLAGISPLGSTTSSPRKQMLGSHMTQCLSCINSDRRSMVTGVEFEMGKYTHSIKMPEDGKIVSVLDRYPKGYGEGSFKINSERVVIYEASDGSLGMVHIHNFSSNHPYFGFQYKQTPEGSKLIEGAYVNKDAVLYDTPNREEDGVYKLGHELNMAYYSHHGSTDDSIVISESAVNKIGYYTYQKRVVQWGENQYPLNLYGNDNEYKIFPDIGDKVHPHGEHKGLLMALRDYDPDMIMVDQSTKSLQTVCHFFDNCVYADGEEGVVVDIKVYHQPPVKGNVDDPDMTKQVNRYFEADVRFRNEVLNVYHRYRSRKGGDIKLSNKLHQFVVDSMAAVHQGNKASDTLNRYHKLTPLNHWRVEFVIRYRNKPSIGSKLTDFMGGKGVISCILPDDQMPVDKNGKRADIIMFPGSNVDRMKYGSLYEQYLNAAKDELRRRICYMLNVTPETAQLLYHKTQAEMEPAIQAIARYHQIVSPIQHQWFMEWSYPEKVKYIVGGIEDKFYDYVPTNNNVYLPGMIKALEEEFDFTYGKVRYKDENGVGHETSENIRIGGVYIMTLEKDGSDWMSVAVGKRQGDNIITFTRGADKHSSPTKKQNVRFPGEAEVRILLAYIGGEHTNKLMERSSNPARVKDIVHRILSAYKPTDIESIHNPNIPLGLGQANQIANHILECGGVKIEYRPYDQSKQKLKEVKHETPSK